MPKLRQILTLVTTLASPACATADHTHDKLTEAIEGHGRAENPDSPNNQMDPAFGGRFTKEQVNDPCFKLEGVPRETTLAREILCSAQNEEELPSEDYPDEVDEDGNSREDWDNPCFKLRGDQSESTILAREILCSAETDEELAPE